MQQVIFMWCAWQHVFLTGASPKFTLRRYIAEGNGLSMGIKLVERNHFAFSL